MAEVVTLGEAMGRLASQGIGPLRHSAALDLGVAGAESNVAIGLARLGVPVQWVGRVGDDEFGRLVVSTLRGEGVEVRAAVDPRARTGLLVRERRTAAVTRVTYYREGSAGSLLAVEDLDEAAIASARLLHVSGITPALGPSARAALDRAVAVARSSGTAVSFDVNFRARLWAPDAAAEVLRPVAAAADVVFAGHAEARLLVGDAVADAELADRLHELGPRHAVVKHGRHGAVSCVDGVARTSAVFEVAEVDPIGAGDAFAAGYLAEWVAGADPATMLDTAARCGALAAAVDGDWEGQPSRDELALLATVDVER
ncbi:sugar kinase [Phycicoccus endophyticus]|uniref:Sugar kinase n=1 Tax=Phycicoccus endophyticus TaxID=1690220 RepID=A0A7G9R215_9MICO|nr:sugar kinase [Phycicoccus endophyticus]NHI19724.1 sugar kinase [Phycicoccus endophyticus]QNN49640.1 sugar kinase [Phycicoccus endophyticus]GGL33555.1 sugar kinase [Phycicoccus endophyticus]